MPQGRAYPPRSSRPLVGPKPELLAPAGGLAAWAAAIEAGADAIYAGFSHFSARALADNFTLPELSGLIRQSQIHGVKVYLAFNSLIKESELPQAFRALIAMAEMGPDAFIMQDLGLAALARRHCPQIPLHASTLTAVYSRAGLVALKKLGFQRAVLPRELSLREIEGLINAEIMPLEIFIHGSMCFSFSGLCLFSSFLGGRSALRGACAQPCRRAWQNHGHRDTFFSAADLSAAEAIAHLRSWPLGALKIEGRMKGPDYVSRVVKAYRLLLDCPEAAWPEALTEAQALLREVASRPTGEGFLAGARSALAHQGVAGLKVGLLWPLSQWRGEVTLEREIGLLDRLRLVAGPGQAGLAFKLRKMLLDGQEVSVAPAGATVTIVLEESETEKSPEAQSLFQGLLYLTGSGRLEKEYLAKEPARKARQTAQSYQPSPKSPPLPPELRPRGAGVTNYPFLKRLWLWLDDLAPLPEITPLAPERLVLSLTPNNARSFGRWKKSLRGGPRVVWSWPPLLFGSSWEKTRRETLRLIDQGFREFLVANLGQAEFLSSLGQGLQIWGDHRLGPLNHFSEAALTQLGLQGVTLSLEVDQETYQGLTKADREGAVLLYLFGRPALFTSRFQPLGLKRGPIVSLRGEKFLAAQEGDAFTILSESRIFMGGYLKGPAPRRLAGLLVDLRQEPRPGEMARAVRKAVAEGRGHLGSSFNLKRGLK
jgi:putative protease